MYDSENILYASYFSVSVLVFLSGVTAYGSNRKHIAAAWGKDVCRKIANILIPYAIATAIYMFNNSHTFNLKTWLDAFLNFSAASPFYFVLFFIQLILISRPLYSIIEKTGISKYRVMLFVSEVAISFILSAVFMRYTFILPVHGGGQFLFGGTYFSIYFIGMIFGKYQQKVNITKKSSLITLSVSVLALAGWYLFLQANRFSLDETILYFGRLNPPGITLIVYALLIILFGFSLNAVLEIFQFKSGLFIRNAFAKAGRYSLYIFLFHMLIIELLRTSPLEAMEIIWLKRIIFMVLIIIVPIAIGIIIKFTIKKVKELCASNTDIESEKI